MLLAFEVCMCKHHVVLLQSFELFNLQLMSICPVQVILSGGGGSGGALPYVDGYQLAPFFL